MNSRQLKKIAHANRGAPLDQQTKATPKDEKSPRKSTTSISEKSTTPWIVQAFVGALLFGSFSWFSIWQFYKTEPAILPLDYGTQDPFRLAFDIKNPFYFDMVDVRIDSKPGPVHIDTTGHAQWHPDLEPLGEDTCNELREIQELPEDPDGNIMVRSKEFPLIESGRSRTYSPGALAISPEVASIYGIAVSYRLKMLGIPLWRRFSCQKFQTVKDNEGKTHFAAQ